MISANNDTAAVKNVGDIIMDPISHREVFLKETIVQVVVLQNSFSVHFEKIIEKKKLCVGESSFGQTPIQSCVAKKSGKLSNSSSPDQLLKISIDTSCISKYKQPFELED